MPIMEKVAVTLYLASRRRTWGVYMGFGPSSMVSAMALYPSSILVSGTSSTRRLRWLVTEFVLGRPGPDCPGCGGGSGGGSSLDSSLARRKPGRRGSLSGARAAFRVTGSGAEQASSVRPPDASRNLRVMLACGPGDAFSSPIIRPPDDLYPGSP